MVTDSTLFRNFPKWKSRVSASFEYLNFPATDRFMERVSGDALEVKGYSGSCDKKAVCVCIFLLPTHSQPAKALSACVCILLYLFIFVYLLLSLLLFPFISFSSYIFCECLLLKKNLKRWLKLRLKLILELIHRLHLLPKARMCFHFPACTTLSHIFLCTFFVSALLQIFPKCNQIHLRFDLRSDLGRF